jgi:N-acyl-D-aspartate/D-glutamate deacylase
MHEASGGRPMSISLMQRDAVPGQYKRILGRVEALAARGLTAKVQVAPRAIGVLLGLEATFHPFLGFPSYREIAHLPLADRVAALRDPARRARMLKEQSGPVAGDGSPIPKLADELLSKINLLAMRIFRLGDPPDYEPTFASSLFAEAQRRGEPDLSLERHEGVLVRVVRVGEGRMGPLGGCAAQVGAGGGDV